MFAYKKEKCLSSCFFYIYMFEEMNLSMTNTHEQKKKIKNTNINNLRRRRCSKILQTAVALVLLRIMP